MEIATAKGVPRVLVFDALLVKWLAHDEGILPDILGYAFKSGKRMFLYEVRRMHCSLESYANALLAAETQKEILGAICGWRWECALVLMEMVRLDRPSARLWQRSPAGPLRSEMLKGCRGLEEMALEETSTVLSDTKARRYISAVELGYLEELLANLFPEERIEQKNMGRTAQPTTICN